MLLRAALAAALAACGAGWTSVPMSRGGGGREIGGSRGSACSGSFGGPSGNFQCRVGRDSGMGGTAWGMTPPLLARRKEMEFNAHTRRLPQQFPRRSLLTLDMRLRRAEQWREKGAVRREGEEWKKQPVPILLLKQSFRLLVWSFFLSWMFELSKRLVMMGGDVLSWTSAASAQGGFPILVQKNLELMTANFASLSAIPPFMQGMVLTMQSWNLPLVYHPVMFLIATIKTALAACFIVLKGIFAFIVCSLQDAGGNLIFIGLQLQKVLFIIATWMLGIASQFFLSDSICLSIFRRDFVFYFITTLVLRRMALFYQNYEDWDATQSRMQLSQPFKGVPRTDSITGKGFWEVLSSSSWIFTAIGFILPFLPIALAAGTGGEWQLVASIFAPYFLGVGLELGTVDLLRDKLKSPAWVAVILPYSIWRILQLSFINTHLESALVLLAPSPLFLFSPPPALIAAAINTPALLSGVWLARLCVHISDIPSFFAWKRKPTAKDREMVLKLRQEVEELKDEVEGLKEKRQRIRVDTWNVNQAEKVERQNKEKTIRDVRRKLQERKDDERGGKDEVKPSVTAKAENNEQST